MRNKENASQHKSLKKVISSIVNFFKPAKKESEEERELRLYEEAKQHHFDELMQIKDHPVRVVRKSSIKPGVMTITEAPKLEELCNILGQEVKDATKMSENQKRKFDRRMSTKVTDKDFKTFQDLQIFGLQSNNNTNNSGLQTPGNGLNPTSSLASRDKSYVTDEEDVRKSVVAVAFQTPSGNSSATTTQTVNNEPSVHSYINRMQQRKASCLDVNLAKNRRISIVSLDCLPGITPKIDSTSSNSNLDKQRKMSRFGQPPNTIAKPNNTNEIDNQYLNRRRSSASTLQKFNDMQNSSTKRGSTSSNRGIEASPASTRQPSLILPPSSDNQSTDEVDAILRQSMCMAFDDDTGGYTSGEESDNDNVIPQPFQQNQFPRRESTSSVILKHLTQKQQKEKMMRVLGGGSKRMSTNKNNYFT
jgi:hypothetical protein